MLQVSPRPSMRSYAPRCVIVIARTQFGGYGAIALGMVRGLDPLKPAKFGVVVVQSIESGRDI
jgi:hypothetical protein